MSDTKQKQNILSDNNNTIDISEGTDKLVADLINCSAEKILSKYIKAFSELAK